MSEGEPEAASEPDFSDDTAQAAPEPEAPDVAEALVPDVIDDSSEQVPIAEAEVVGTSSVFTMVDAGMGHACGLRDDGTVACWGNHRSGQSLAPDGLFSVVGAGWDYSCALRQDGAVVCWGANVDDQSRLPAGRFEALSVGSFVACGLRDDGTIECWEAGRSDPLVQQAVAGNVPEGEFTAVSVGSSQACALRASGELLCWGLEEDLLVVAPSGRFQEVGVGDLLTCGLRTDGTVACWGYGEREPRVPSGTFETISVGFEHACGLRSDATAVCWGIILRGPGGQFDMVSAGGEYPCGVRAGGTVECWGDAGWYQHDVPAPPGVEYQALSAAPSPVECRPHKGSYALGPGFPLDWFALPSTGTLRVAVVFVDFPDAAAAYPVQREAEAGLPYAEQYLESASHGKLDVEFVPLDRWLRLEHGFGHYSFSFEGEAARLADEHFDFADFDVMMAVAPSSSFGAALARGIVTTDEGSITTVQINTDFSGFGDNPKLWGFTAAHELMHNLGLADLYDLDDSLYGSVDVPEGEVLTWIDLGLMGLGALFLVDEDDPGRAYEFYATDGVPSTGIWPQFTAAEMLSWSRWQVGWLEPHQVACVSGDATVDLKPVAVDPGDGIGMVAVPLSDHEVIVVESRRKIGYDARAEQPLPDGTRENLPALGPEGVLVYTVDASIGSGQVPIKVVSRGGYGVFEDYPLLAVGESVTVRGYTITVETDDGDTHTVTITRTGDG